MTKEEKPKGGPTLTVLNQGARPYLTSAGPLTPGKSLELPVEEAKKLMAYKGVVDAENVVPGLSKASSKAMRKENERLRKENDDLRKGKPAKKEEAEEKDKKEKKD